MRAGDAIDLDPALAAHAPHRTSYRGLEILIVYLQARRGLLFDRFRAIWAEQERAGTWERSGSRDDPPPGDRTRAPTRREAGRTSAGEARRRGEEEREAASRAASAAAELQTARRKARGELLPRREGG